MGSANTSSQTQNQTQTNNPWAPTTSSLTSSIPGLSTALSQSQAGNAATLPSQFIAGLNPQQIANFNAMLAYGGNQTPTIQQGAGTSLTNTGVAGTNSALSALMGFNPSAAYNPGTLVSGANAIAGGFNPNAVAAAAELPAQQVAFEQTLPGIDQAAASSGNSNSSRAGIAQGLVQSNLAENTQSLATQLAAQAYGTGIGATGSALSSNNANLLSALESGGALGLNAANAGTNVLNSGVSNAGNIFNIAGTGGQGLQTGAQQTLQNQILANQFATQNPFSSYQNYLPLLESISGLGGTSNTTGTTTSTPSALSLVGGILGGAGSLLGASNPVTGMTSGFGGIQNLMNMFKGTSNNSNASY